MIDYKGVSILMYKEMYTQGVQTQASNVGAITGTASRVAMSIASVVGAGAMMSLGGKMAEAGLVAGNVAKASSGMSLQRGGAALLANKFGGFGGAIIASNMVQAFQSDKYGERLNELLLDEQIKKEKHEKYIRELAQLPSEFVDRLGLR